MFFQTKQDSLQLVSSSAATLDVTVITEDANTGKSRRTYKINSATTTTISPSPINNTTVKTVIVVNTDASVASTVILQLNDGANSYAIYQATLPAKYSLHCTETGIELFSDAGIAVGSGGGGGGGITDGDKGDITVSAAGAVWSIDNGVVTLAKMANMPTSSLIYRKTAGTGVPETQTLVTLKADLGLTGTNSGDQTSIVGITGTKAQFNTAVTDGDILYVGDVTSNATHTGDVTGSTALTIASNVVDNTKLSDMATARIKGRLTAGTGDPEDLTGTQVTTLIDTFTTTLKGVVPGSGGGTTNFLRADGTWAAPPGGGGGVSDGDKGDITVSSSGTVWTIDTTAPVYSEVIAARFSNSLLDTTINNIMRKAKPAGFTSGRYYADVFMNAGNPATGASAANRFELVPWFCPADITIDRLGLEVTTAVASSLAKVVIYSSNSQIQPDTLIFEGATDLDCSTNGFKEHTLSPTISLQAGRWYWMGHKSNSTQTFRSVGAGQLPILGGSSSGGGTTHQNGIRRTLTYATPAPTTFSYTITDLSNGINAAIVYFRIV